MSPYRTPGKPYISYIEKKSEFDKKSEYDLWLERCEEIKFWKNFNTMWGLVGDYEVLYAEEAQYAAGKKNRKVIQMRIDLQARFVTFMQRWNMDKIEEGTGW